MINLVASFAEAKKLLDEYGPNELPEKRKPGWRIFLEQFLAPTPIMIACALPPCSVTIHVQVLRQTKRILRARQNLCIWGVKPG